MKTQIKFLALVTVFMAFSCGGPTKYEPEDTIDSGTTTIAMDDSYTFLFETLRRVFQDQNPEANINTLVKNESDAIQALLDDSCKVIVLNRELTKSELDRKSVV